MSISNLEKLTVIMHKFGIDYYEFNRKFENIEREEGIFIEYSQPSSPVVWEPYNLTFDPNNDYISASSLGNGVYAYTMDRSVDTSKQGYMTASNPINSSKGSIVFWMSTSAFFGEDISIFWPGVLGQETTLQAGSTSGRDAYGGGGYVATWNNMSSLLDSSCVINNGEWGLVVVVKDTDKDKIYMRGKLAYTGTIGTIASLTGSRKFFDNTDWMVNPSPPPDFNTNYIKLGFANIAFTNRILTLDQITSICNAGITANYSSILGFTPEAYWRGEPVSGTPYYVQNERF